MENYFTRLSNSSYLSFFNSIGISYKKKLLVIFTLSIASGLPFLLLLSTLSIWLIESGVSKTKIGLFAFATVPYAVKFLFAPILDNMQLPYLGKLLGKRRSWLLFMQVGLVTSLLLLANSNPTDSLGYTAISALLVGLFSAGQDIIIEAYRIEILGKSQVGVGSTCSVLGYRIGMLISGAGALYCASYFNSWASAYNIMAAILCMGILATLFANEPKHSVAILPDLYQNKATFNLSELLKKLLIFPAKELLKNNNVILVLAFILFFKFVDTVLNIMTMPFLIEIGFSKLEIANVAKTFGICAMVFGGVYAGIYLQRHSLYKLLLLSAYFQLIASVLFIFQSIVGNNIYVLLLTMGVENITCGMGQVAMIAYLSLLCNKSHTACHYAILSSLASFARVQFSAISGAFADSVSWVVFYTVVAIFCLPIIFIIVSNKQYFNKVGLAKA